MSSKWRFSDNEQRRNDREVQSTAGSRLVARGVSQIPNVDHFNSSFPCPSSASIKMMPGVAKEKGMNLNHWDVKQAYTHAKLDEEIFMRLLAECGKKIKS